MTTTSRSNYEALSAAEPTSNPHRLLGRARAYRQLAQELSDPDRARDCSRQAVYLERLAATAR